MSSTYQVFCMNSSDRALSVSTHTSAAGVVPACGGAHDWTVGRYSPRLVAVGCPPQKIDVGMPGRRLVVCCHAKTKWVDTQWLRLLAAAREAPNIPVGNTGAFACWTKERLYRLRFELGTTALYPGDPNCPECDKER